MTLSEAFEDCLEIVVERCEDPAALVYNELFIEFPDMQDLFVMDEDGKAKAHMFNLAIECAQDFLDSGTYAHNFIAAERQNHAGLGISDDVFDAFFVTLQRVFSDLVGTEWSAEMDQAWQMVEKKTALARL